MNRAHGRTVIAGDGNRARRTADLCRGISCGEEFGAARRVEKVSRRDAHACAACARALSEPRHGSRRGSPGRQIVRANTQALVGTIELAIKTAWPQDAEIVAAEAVAHGELKDHRNWELIGKLAAELKDPERSLVKAAYDKVEDKEDEHFYRTKGWARELWAKALGIPAVIPPPEERLGVKSPLGEAMAVIGRK